MESDGQKFFSGRKISMRLKNISNINLKISMKIKQRDAYCLL